MTAIRGKPPKGYKPPVKKITPKAGPRAIRRPEPRRQGRPPDNISKALSQGERRTGPYTPKPGIKRFPSRPPGAPFRVDPNSIDVAPFPGRKPPRPQPARPPRAAAPENPIMPPGGWSNVDPIPEVGTIANPHTDTMAGPPAAAPTPAPGPKLARPVSNAGTNGSNARYHVGPGSGLTRGDRGWTDGVYWYDDNGLSLDRPDSFVPGLPPANESEAYDPYTGRTRGGGGGGGGGGAPAPPAPPSISSILGGEYREQAYMTPEILAQLFGGAPAAQAMSGVDAGVLGNFGGGASSLDAMLQALIARTRAANPYGGASVPA